jgi:endoglucanase
VLLEPGEYFWGSNAHALNKAVLLIIAFEETQEADFLEVALDQLHYMLGANAHRMTFVTGVGTRAPLHPHHRPSAADGVAAPVPGLLAGGANQYLQDAVLAAHFNSSTPPALAYLDDQGSYASNEIAINWNAPLVFVSGYFAKPAVVSGVKSPGPAVPKSIRLEQNFPNPFNGSTVIRFSLQSAGRPALVITDLLGREVLDQDLGWVPAGIGHFTWDGRDKAGAPLSSGIYLCYLQTQQRSEVRKILLVK